MRGPNAECGRPRIILVVVRKNSVHERLLGLGGHLKTGHTWPLQNRPTDQTQDKICYTLATGIPQQFSISDVSGSAGSFSVYTVGDRGGG